MSCVNLAISLSICLVPFLCAGVGRGSRTGLTEDLIAEAYQYKGKTYTSIHIG